MTFTVPAPYLVLALGNDLLGDDGVALAAARTLGEEFNDGQVDVIESSEAGLALMEIMSGYKKVLIIDSVKTEKHPPGTVIEFKLSDFDKIVAPSPHYAGLPEVLDTAKRLQIPFPDEVRVVGLEVVNPYDFSESFSEPVAEGLPGLIEKASDIVREFVNSAKLH